VNKIVTLKELGHSLEPQRSQIEVSRVSELIDFAAKETSC
jgi:hypothetical protein